ncbi:MAG: cation transporter [Clostridia bacterium]|nr:cation transporter [Clostridia bacterium]
MENREILSTSPDVRIRYGKLAGAVGIVANLLLFAVKITVGLLTSGIAIIADSLNNLSDAGSSALTLFGYALSGKPADKEHPYGHARIEYLCGLFISVIVTFLGVETLTGSIKKLSGEGEESVYPMATVIIIAASILVKVAIAIFYTKVGKKIDSVTLRAAAADSISDVIATSAVVAGMLLTPITGPLTDGIVGCVIAVYIIVLGIKLIRESSDILLGQAPGEDFVNGITTRLKNYDGVLGIHDLVIHSYGANRYFASVHVEVDSTRDMLEAHDSIDNMEADFRGDGINLVIHMDPVCVSDPETNTLRAQVSDLVQAYGEEQGIEISMHDFRIVKGVTHTNVLFDVSISSDVKATDRAIMDVLSGRIRQIDPKLNTVLTVDRDYFSHRMEQ